jgi:hypothetical protein
VIGYELEEGGVNIGMPSVAGGWVLIKDDSDLITYPHDPRRVGIVFRQIHPHETTVPPAAARRVVSACPENSHNPGTGVRALPNLTRAS